jgi:tetratricopeptide (TPR) repeat protein
MRNFKLTIIILFIYSGISCYAMASLTDSNGFDFKNISKKVSDTSDVYRYTRNALSFVSKQWKIQYIKANIDTAESICEKENIEIPALLHLARAEYFFLTSDYRNALQEATFALKMSNNSDETDVMARTMNFLGRYNLRTGFFKESIDYFKNSIDLAQTNHLKGFIPKNYEGLADVYSALDDITGFQQSLKKMIEAALAENDSLNAESGYLSLGTSLTDKNRNFRLADTLLKRAYDISIIKKDTVCTAKSLANIGWNFYVEKMYDSSFTYYSKSLNYSLPGRQYSTSANSYGNIGNIYRDLGDPEKSLKNYIKAIDQAKKVDDWYSLSWVYNDMNEMYLRKKDTSDAYKSYILFKQFSDSMIITRSHQGLTNARVRYEADTHNKELELLSLRIKNQRLLIYGYTGLFVLSIAIGLLVFSRAKINAKRRISEMNRKISEITQANLRQQMNPHFIFNTLNSIQYYMYQHDKLATNNYLTKFSSLMRKVLENSQHTSVPLRDELDALNLYLELEKIRFKDKFEYEIKIDEEIDTLLYKVPTMLIQPYVENSICHGLMPGESNGSVKIDLKLENKYISCTIEDNGIGREAAQEKKRKSENTYSSLGTQIISSRLDLVNSLYGTSLKTIYTDLKNEIGEPVGTRVEIQIPILT